MLRNGLGPNAKDVVKDDQRQWLQFRNHSCSVARDTPIDGPNRDIYLHCFRKAYADRAGDLISKVGNIAIEQADFDQLRGLAEGGDADAEAVLGYILSEGNGADIGNRHWRDPAASVKWLKKAAGEGQMLAREDYEAILTGGQSSGEGDTLCGESIDVLSDGEAARILPLLGVQGRADRVSFSCRDPGNGKHLIIGTNIGAEFGQVVSVTLAVNEAKIGLIDHGQFQALDIVRDKSGTPFLLMSSSSLDEGLLNSGHTLVNFRTGEKIRTAVASEETAGWCKSGDFPTSGRMTYAKQRRADGLYDLVYRLETMDCATRRTTRHIYRYRPTEKGFAP